MNPGPAPRPPTERPRLNLTPSTQNLPGNMIAQNMSQMSISPITRSATSTYTGSTVALPLQRQQPNMMGEGGVTIIKEGWASVKEGKSFMSTWKQKWLILRKEALDFHKTDGGKVSYQIVLKDVLGVSRVEASGTIFEIKRALNGTSTNPGDDDGNSLSKTLQIRVKSDDDLYEWIDFIYARCPGMGGVSNPTNFSHSVHVGFDPQTGEFVGLPPEWSKLLNSSAITKEDYERNPQAVFEVLEFYSDITKRAENPSQYSSLTPTPSTNSNQNKQLGYTGGASVAPPRPIQNQQQRNNSYGQPQVSSPGGPPRRPTPPDQQQQQRQQMQQMASNYVDPETRERERERQKQIESQRQRDMEDQIRRENEAYNASLPKTRVPTAEQELGGYGGGSSVDRYNPSRAAPPAPGARQPQQGQAPAASLRTQRQAPSAPTPSNQSQRPPISNQQSSSSASRDQNGGIRSPTQPNQNGQRPQDPRYQNGGQQPAARTPQQQNPPSRLPAPINQVKPLNVASKQPTGASNGITQNDAIKAAESALTAKPPPERKNDVRMSTMTESEVMVKLKEAVSKDDPNLSYSKQKKIGQGASGSVYVAKVKENPFSPIAKEVIRQQGPKAQVAIKQMDLAHQPRKELIVNEIMVMKDSKHRNIVNFLDAFLRNNFTELWVVMEYMEGGALTDVIDNNPNITEDQISTICLEVSFNETILYKKLTFPRPAEDWSICISKASFIVTLRVTTFCSMLAAMSRLVSHPSPKVSKVQI